MTDKHGEWWYSWNDYICSECGYKIDDRKKGEFKFCPNCGAKMDKQSARHLREAMEKATGTESLNEAFKALIVQVLDEWSKDAKRSEDE